MSDLACWNSRLIAGRCAVVSHPSTPAHPSMPNLLENQKQVLLTFVTRMKRCHIHFDGTRQHGFLPRSAEASGESVKFAVAAANNGLVLVATGIHAALIKIAETAKPDPIPDMQGVGRTASDYWQLFSQTASLTILITFIALLAWPAEQTTRFARNDRELAQAILRKGPFVDEIFVLVLVSTCAI